MITITTSKGGSAKSYEKLKIPPKMIADLRAQGIYICVNDKQRFNILSESEVAAIYREYESGGNLESYKKKKSRINKKQKAFLAIKIIITILALIYLPQLAVKYFP